MVPDPKTLMWSHYAFASQYVIDMVLERLLQSAPDDFEIFLANSYGLPELAQVRSCLFESYVHHVLSLGGEYELRDLESGEPLCTARC